ncbi:MAG: hypothetical protein F6K17_07410, partial [Okeania sp. SIO3C4]|nr:hypothetical protein [Okeania sp. SIO3C4]
MKCLAILNQENVVKGFGMLDFPPVDVAELFRAENLKYLNFVILRIP